MANKRKNIMRSITVLNNTYSVKMNSFILLECQILLGVKHIHKKKKQKNVIRLTQQVEEHQVTSPTKLKYNFIDNVDTSITLFT